VEITAAFVLRYGNGIGRGYFFYHDGLMSFFGFWMLDFGLWIVNENGTHGDRLKEHMAT
jgi:hypothetical protein